MREITVSVDEHTHQLACIRAAELDTSVSALLRDYLMSFARDGVGASEIGQQRREKERERRIRLLNDAVGEITINGGGLRMSANLPRESLYDRSALH